MNEYFKENIQNIYELKGINNIHLNLHFSEHSYIYKTSKLGQTLKLSDFINNEKSFFQDIQQSLKKKEKELDIVNSINSMINSNKNKDKETSKEKDNSKEKKDKDKSTKSRNSNIHNSFNNISVEGVRCENLIDNNLYQRMSSFLSYQTKPSNYAIIRPSSFQIVKKLDRSNKKIRFTSKEEFVFKFDNTKIGKNNSLMLRKNYNEVLKHKFSNLSNLSINPSPKNRKNSNALSQQNSLNLNLGSSMNTNKACSATLNTNSDENNTLTYDLEHLNNNIKSNKSTINSNHRENNNSYSSQSPSHDEDLKNKRHSYIDPNNLTHLNNITSLKKKSNLKKKSLSDLKDLREINQISFKNLLNLDQVNQETLNEEKDTQRTKESHDEKNQKYIKTIDTSSIRANYNRKTSAIQQTNNSLSLKVKEESSKALVFGGTVTPAFRSSDKEIAKSTNEIKDKEKSRNSIGTTFTLNNKLANISQNILSSEKEQIYNKSYIINSNSNASMNNNVNSINYKLKNKSLNFNKQNIRPKQSLQIGLNNNLRSSLFPTENKKIDIHHTNVNQSTSIKTKSGFGIENSQTNTVSRPNNPNIVSDASKNKKKSNSVFDNLYYNGIKQKSATNPIAGFNNLGNQEEKYSHNNELEVIKEDNKSAVKHSTDKEFYKRIENTKDHKQNKETTKGKIPKVRNSSQVVTENTDYFKKFSRISTNEKNNSNLSNNSNKSSKSNKSNKTNKTQETEHTKSSIKSNSRNKSCIDIFTTINQKIENISKRISVANHSKNERYFCFENKENGNTSNVYLNSSGNGVDNNNEANERLNQVVINTVESSFLTSNLSNLSNNFRSSILENIKNKKQRIDYSDNIQEAGLSSPDNNILKESLKQRLYNKSGKALNNNTDQITISGITNEKGSMQRHYKNSISTNLNYTNEKNFFNHNFYPTNYNNQIESNSNGERFPNTNKLFKDKFPLTKKDTFIIDESYNAFNGKFNRSSVITKEDVKQYYKNLTLTNKPTNLDPKIKSSSTNYNIEKAHVLPRLATFTSNVLKIENKLFNVINPNNKTPEQNSINEYYRLNPDYLRILNIKQSSSSKESPNRELLKDKDKEYEKNSDKSNKKTDKSIEIGRKSLRNEERSKSLEQSIITDNNKFSKDYYEKKSKIHNIKSQLMQSKYKVKAKLQN